MKRDILIIGDAHAKPGVSNERFVWAGRYAAEHQPEYIVDMGDWEDMPSLSSYDVGKKSYEGRRYSEDLKAAHQAREAFEHGLEVGNRALRKKHKPLYRPTKVALGGNHGEGRISRVLEEDAKLVGTIGSEDLGAAKYGWRYVPYREYVSIQGFTFCHLFASGVMGRPIGGEMPALTLIRKQLTSCVAGHNHLFDIAHRTRPDGTRVWGIFAGCYLAEDQIEDYAGQANKLWWRGLIRLKGAENGDFESIETISIRELRARYGK